MKNKEISRCHYLTILDGPDIDDDKRQLHNEIILIMCKNFWEIYFVDYVTPAEILATPSVVLNCSGTIYCIFKILKNMVAQILIIGVYTWGVIILTISAIRHYGGRNKLLVEMDYVVVMP